MQGKRQQPNDTAQGFTPLRRLALPALLSLASLGASAAETDRHLLVGLYDNPPKVYRSETDQPAGLFVDLLETMARQHGWTLEYRDCQWNDCLQALEAGELDLMPDVAATDQRRRRFAFHQVPVTQAWSQLYRPAHLDLLTLDDLRGLRISVLEGSVQQVWFQSRPELEVELVTVTSMMDGFAAVAEQRAEAAATNNFFGARFASRHGLAEAAITFDQQSLHFAAPLTADPQVLHAIDRSLAQWKGETDSPYYRALQRALVPPVVSAIPQWAAALTVSLAFIVVLLSAVSSLLRWRIKVRTRALESSRQQLEHVLDSSPVVLYRASSNELNPNWVSPNIERLFGFQAADLTTGNSWEEQILEDDREQRRLTAATLPEAGQLALDYRIRDRHGQIRHLRDEMRLLPARGGLAEVIGSWTDLTADYQQQARIRYLSKHDRLTGLPNRSFLYQQIDTAIAHSKLSGQAGMVLMIDLDRFGAINETAGMAIGDQLLAAQARRLLAEVSATDLVARSGNDEFCLLLAAPDSPQSIALLCQSVLEAIAAPITVEGKSLSITASVGLAHFPAHGTNASDVMAAAELALQQARKGGGNSWEIYHPELGTVTSQRMHLEQDINQALEQNQFMLVFQPQYRLHGQDLIGMETLIRWQHPERGLVTPGEFIPFAEETGQIRKIDLWVLHRACRQLANWQSAGLQVPRLSINLSASEFRSEALADTVAAVIQEYRIPANRLELEITETTLMEAPDKASAVLRRLHQLGLHLSMDDFGTGYSNLVQLLALPLDQLKIDQSLLGNIENSAQKRSVLKAIIALAEALDMELIAEGIETQAQLAFLKQAGCPLGQGFLLGRPMPVAEATELLKAAMSAIHSTSQTAQERS